MSEAPDTSCNEYCNTITKSCTGADAQFVFLTGGADPMPACLTICGLYSKEKVATGPTQKCRADQLTLLDEAKTPAAKTTVCKEAGPFSESCGGMLANYCRLDLALCQTSVFGTQQACETALAGIKFGEKGINDDTTVDENSLVCRFYHLQKTTESASIHCPHTKAPVSPVCVR